MSDAEMDSSNVDDIESDEEMADTNEDEVDGDKVNEDELVEGLKEVYLPGRPLDEGEELVCDQTAYVMYHQAQTSAPCLSFDILKDDLGYNRESYPLTAYIVAGTQAAQTQANHVIVMKLSNLNKNKTEPEDEGSDDEDNDNNPKMAAALIKHQGCVNRIRSTNINGTTVAASWSELGRVNIWDLSLQLQTVEDDQLVSKYNKDNMQNSITPLFTFSGHQKEGFGLDWSPTMPGFLASGDCNRNIHIWQPDQAGSWAVDQRPLLGHTNSVEDIQWSPNERNVLASCSVDKSIRIWDSRANPSKACMLVADDAHQTDVNVISWNKNEPFIVSGGDDGYLHIWDLRKFQTKTPLATFKHHTESIASVEWHQTDAAVFASAGSDNQIALWDLSVEKDAEDDGEDIEDVPPQLLFIHQGQNNIKELHWHAQLPGVIISTAESGFNIFRTISV